MKRTIWMWRLMVLPALALVLNGAHAAVPAEELLQPEKAFRISTRALDERIVEVRFDIADGYYMYRDRFKFETQSGKVLPGADIPRGVRKKDEFFGETETHRREIVIRVPLQADDIEAGRVKLKVTSQGCSDQGVCYVPLEQLVELKVPSGYSTAHPSSVRPWMYVLVAAGFLMLLAMSYRLASPPMPSRAVVGMARRSYPALAFALIALVVWAGAPLLTRQLIDLAWGALLIFAATWLRAIDPPPEAASGAHRFGKAMGVLALVAGVVFVVFAAGGRDLLTASRGPGAAQPAEQSSRLPDAVLGASATSADKGGKQ